MPAQPTRASQKRYQNQLASPSILSLRKIWQEYQWQIVLVSLAVSLTLGYIGFDKYTRAIGEPRSITDLLYLTLQLTTLESGAVSGPVSWELEVARLLVPMLTAYTAVLAAAVLFRKQLQMVRLWYLRRHIIICGLGEKGWLLASQLRQSGRDVVVIEIEPGNPKNETCREKGIIVLEGDASELSILRKAAVQRASHLVSVCGKDGVNAEVATGARQLSATRKNGVLTCTIHITNPQLCEFLREQEFGLETFPTFRLEMFNIFERGARTLLSEFSPFDLKRENKPIPPHILVVGLRRLGENLVIQAARSWYEISTGNDELLRISVVDNQAKDKTAQLQNRFPKLPCRCELIPLQTEIEDLQFQKSDFLFTEAGTCKFTSVFICLGDQTLGLQAALTLRQRIDHHLPPIVIRMREDSGLAKLLTGEQENAMTFHNILPFGLLQRTCTPDLVLGGTHEILAQAVHADYLRRRLQEGLKMGSKRAMAYWYDLPPDLRESNRRQVDHIRLKLHTVGYEIKPLSDWDAANYQFSDAEIEKMAQMEHEHWMQERLRNGWSFAKGVEDARNRTHPDLVSWELLPEPVKDKDRQPAIELPGLLARAGFQVYRLP